jgi:hypothetical protein
MRVPYQVRRASPRGKSELARAVGLAGALLGLSACSSAPLDDAAPTDDAAGGSAPSGGSPSASAGTSSAAGSASNVADGPVYTKRDYPAGPYGTGVQAVIEDFAFLGWRDPVAAGYDVNKLEQVRLSDFYNPDGRSDVKLIWVNASAVWCSVCRSEMADIKSSGIRANLAPKGLQLVETLFEDNSSGPARPSDLKNWGSAPAHSIDFPLLLDPGFKLGAFFTSDATPLNMLVDAKTMKVLDATMGYSSDYWQRVEKLLDKLK